MAYRQPTQRWIEITNPDPNTYIYEVKSWISRIDFNFTKFVESTSLVYYFLYV